MHPPPVSTLLKKKVKKVIPRKRVTISKREGSEVLQTAHRLYDLAKTEICSLIESGRSGRALGDRIESEIVGLLVERWEAYRSPDTASASLERDFRRLLEFAFKPTVNSPAAYLLKTLRAKDWRSDPDPKSQSAAITKAGPKAERPVEDLNRRSGGGLLDVSQDRLAKAVERICAHPKAPEKLIEGVRSLNPSTPAEALRLAISLEQAVVALGESH